MPVIDAGGLFDGERLNKCSKMAQLYYPRMLSASNGFGRIQLSYRLLTAHAFANWTHPDIPLEEELMGYFQEYAQQRLIFLYKSGEQLWGQWDAKRNTFGKYQTTTDKRSPEPPAELFEKWVQENRNNSKSECIPIAHFQLIEPKRVTALRQNCGKISEPCGNNAEGIEKVEPNFTHGIGIGIGIVDGIGTPQTPQEKRVRADTSDDFIQYVLEGSSIPGSPLLGTKISLAVKFLAKQRSVPLVEAADHLVGKICTYRNSPAFKADKKFNWLNWMSDGRYDEPEERWNGKAISSDFKPASKTPDWAFKKNQ